MFIHTNVVIRSHDVALHICYVFIFWQKRKPLHVCKHHTPKYTHTHTYLHTHTLSLWLTHWDFEVTVPHHSNELSWMKRLCWTHPRLHTVCPHILSVEKGREGAWIQSHSFALPARSRRARQRQTHSESQKVPASVSASAPFLQCLSAPLPGICPR